MQNLTTPAFVVPTALTRPVSSASLWLGRMPWFAPTCPAEAAIQAKDLPACRLPAVPEQDNLRSLSKPSAAVCSTGAVPQTAALEAAAVAALSDPVPYSICSSFFPCLSLSARLLLLLPFSRNFELRDLPLSYPTFAPPPDALDSLPKSAHLAVPALSALAAAHASATGAKCVMGRIAVFAGTPCSRVHVDYVRLRSIATLAGVGTVVAPPGALRPGALKSSARQGPFANAEEHDAAVLRDAGNDDPLVYCNEGDALFMRGFKAVGTVLEEAAAHRSPRISEWKKRLVVQVDDCECESDLFSLHSDA